jgi:hypothetical protein
LALKIIFSTRWKSLAVLLLITAWLCSLIGIGYYGTGNDTKFVLINDDRISAHPDPEGEAEYTTMRSIGDLATYVISQKKVKGPILPKDLAKFLADADPKYLFPAGVKWYVNEEGFLEWDYGSSSTTVYRHRYKVYSDGSQVIVTPKPDGKAIYLPYK